MNVGLPLLVDSHQAKITVEQLKPVDMVNHSMQTNPETTYLSHNLITLLLRVIFQFLEKSTILIYHHQTLSQPKLNTAATEQLIYNRPIFS